MALFFFLCMFDETEQEFDLLSFFPPPLDPPSSFATLISHSSWPKASDQLSLLSAEETLEISKSSQSRLQCNWLPQPVIMS